jgi:hypothetical protein
VNTTVCDVDFAYLPAAALVAVIEHVVATLAVRVAVPFPFGVSVQSRSPSFFFA